MISQTSAYGAASGTTQNQKTTSEDKNALGKDSFLKLLIAQMKNQDPLNPVDNTEFVAQLAQFSSLEQMTQMNTTLEQTLASNTGIAELISNSMAINYFGQTVSAETETILYNGDDTEFAYELAQTAADGALHIYDANGTIIYSERLTGLGKGLHTMSWDGKTQNGIEAPEGTYYARVQALDTLGENIEAVTILTGTVQGITYQNGSAMLDLDGVLVAPANIREIRETES